MPVSLLLDSSLSDAAIRLAGLLLHYDGPQGCFPGIASLMQDLRCSKRTVLRTLEELERYGFVERQRRGRRNRYRLHVVYDQPTRPASIIRTGVLEIENDAPRRPVARHRLDSKGATEGTNRAPKPVPIGAVAGTGNGATAGTYSPKKVPRRAPVYDQEPGLIKNQQQQEAAAAERSDRIGVLLQDDGFFRDDALAWAAELCDLDPDEVLAAARTMRGRVEYRQQRIRSHPLYLRKIIRDVAELRKGAPAIFDEIDPVEPIGLAAKSMRELSPDERVRAESLASQRGGGPIALAVAASEIRRKRTAEAP